MVTALDYGPYRGIITDSIPPMVFGRYSPTLGLANDYRDLFMDCLRNVPQDGDVLFLGCGGGIGAIQALSIRPDVRVHLCDSDAEIINLGCAEFGLDLSRIANLQVVDAAIALRRSSATYDAIVIDVYDRSGGMPDNVASQAFVDAVVDKTAPSGLSYWNIAGVVAFPQTPGLLPLWPSGSAQRAILGRLARASQRLTLIDSPSSRNTIVRIGAAMPSRKGSTFLENYVAASWLASSLSFDVRCIAEWAEDHGSSVDWATASDAAERGIIEQLPVVLRRWTRASIGSSIGQAASRECHAVWRELHQEMIESGSGMALSWLMRMACFMLDCHVCTHGVAALPHGFLEAESRQGAVPRSRVWRVFYAHAKRLNLQMRSSAAGYASLLDEES